METIELESEKQWLSLLESSSETPVLVFKHSTRCPISAEAHDQWLSYLGDSPNPDIEYAIVLVVESRPVSNLIADTLNVKHESPQAILVKGRRAVWHTSHGRITEPVLREVLGGDSVTEM
ncbi:bacillithiol system redox-active protein YtxJ [Paenibacillus flagellatus]|uniref:Bacillithiol system redox-active protein YtxJ n=1 Tax=Paenibacillus flagellatus TaxID=2211139 RepID=A0A2V5KSK3_9BACL|nr:bacillithiol system redox-active protein YtxJ [Paenibacillus flagellatus]PYI54647.1 bacillithiol system redox-active protein YtxJ [Paenibacillus flagellatus]